MPKNPLKFARRRSSGNVLDDVSSSPAEPTPPTTSSFRVLERVEKINLNAGNAAQQSGRKQVTRPFNSPLAQLRGRSAEELGPGVNRCVDSGSGGGGDWLLKGARGSGGTTNSGSSGYYDSSSASARHSSSSTLPSSVDAEREQDDELFPRKTQSTPMYHNVHTNGYDPPQPPTSFTSRAARALSFGTNKHNRNGSATENIPHLPTPPKGAPSYPARSHSPPQRERALTTSSYASTAKPDLNLNLSSTDFGSDFGSMFDTPRSERYDTPLPPPKPIATFHRTESEPMFPPRAHSRQAYRPSPSPELLKQRRDDAGSPYSWDHGRNSNEGLMSSSALESPTADAAPPVPSHATGIVPAFLGKSKTAYSLVPDRHSPGPERLSQDSPNGFYGGTYDEPDSRQQSPTPDENPWLKKVELHDSQDSTSTPSKASSVSSDRPQTRKPLGMPSQTVAGASRPVAKSPQSAQSSESLWASESMNSTPRAAKLELPKHNDESLFDSSPQGPPSRALRPQHMRTESGTPKKMTRAQFERLQRGANGSADQSDEGENAEDDYDDEDDAERAKQVTRQRRKQEANMAVYRQQMKKVTGGGPSDLPDMPTRPGLDRAAASAPALPGSAIHFGGIGGQPPADSVRAKQNDDDDDDVPLGILQAHGFPAGGKPPNMMAGNDQAAQRRMSGAGSVVGGGAGQGNLPPFARGLPQDPYFGAGLVNQSNREALGFSGAPRTPSVYGGGMPPSMASMQQMMPQQSPGGHPGGLVGVIAGEERARAARRGSPNPATGTYGPTPTNMPQMNNGMPGMPRTMSMGNVASPQTYMPSGFGTNPMMPHMPMMSPMQQMPPGQNMQQDQMQQFMQMQMQVMQNMLSMQQQQMVQTPSPQQQQAQDYLGVHMPGTTQPNGAPSIRNQAPMNNGRAMTMMNPPRGWDVSPGAQRPNSAMPNTYAPTGLNIGNGGGPGQGYTPSIAPTERSNIGQPSRYRPVTTGLDANGRSQSMTSSLTLQAYGNGNRQPSPDVSRPTTLQAQHQSQQSKSTVRLIDKPKGTPKVSTRPVVADEDDEEGWAEMRKKRDAKKKFSFRKGKDNESSLGELYPSYE